MIEFDKITNGDRVVQRICRAAIAAIVVLPVWLGASHGLVDFERNQALEAALIGAAVIHLWTRPKWTAWLPALAIGAFGCVVYGIRRHGFGTFWVSTLGTCAAFAGVGSLLVLTVQLCIFTRPHRARVRNTLIAAAAFPYFTFILAFALNLTTALRPKIYDLILYGFDETLQIHAGAWIGHLFAVSFPLRVAGILVYEYLPTAICLLLALQRARPDRFSVDPMRLFISVGVAGAVLYSVLPACGPIYAFGARFPDNLPPLSGLEIQPFLLAGKPRNAMPSLHFACALLIVWNAAGLNRVWRALAAAFLGMTFFATLGFGEHYLVDLVVAVPFAVAMQAACLESIPWICLERRTACYGSGALTLVWMAALRFGWFPVNGTAICWTAIAVTVLLSLRWKHGLNRGQVGLQQQVLPVRPVILAQEP